MNFNQELTTTQLQSLVMTTQLKQSLDILNMSKLELDEQIKREVEENPLIEAEKSRDIDWEEYIKYIEKSSKINKSELNYNYHNETNFETIIGGKNNLYDELNFQISLYNLEPIQMKICKYIINNLDYDGYLRVDEEIIINKLNINKEMFIQCLLKVQQLEPNGVGARNISECLTIQIKNLGIENQVLERIINEDLNLIAKNKYKDISKKYKMQLKECVNLIQIVKNLNPKPGIVYSNENSIYIFPDVIVEKIDKKFIAFKNKNDNYHIRINNFYKEILKNSDSDKDAKEFIKEKLNLASNLIKSIDNRDSTILKIAQEIVKEQEMFFEKGINYIKPMRMKDIAQKLDFHESTISRGVNGKYMLTPFGMFEFKYFFTGSINSDIEKGTSSTSIKKLIKDKIKTENKYKPLSDEKIAKILKEEGINIARRTVTKYREELNILSSSKRKQY